MTLAEAINKAAAILAERGIPDAGLDAELLLRHVLKRDRAWLLAHIHAALDERHQSIFDDLIRRRAKREPVQHIIGKQEFRGLDFKVTLDVLIPRPETELVVESALEAVQGNAHPVIVDLCAGSGCIAVSLAKELPGAHVFATDKSGRALDVARENARSNSVAERIRFLEGDLFGPLEELDLRGRADVIASNPPYVRSGDLSSLQPEVRDFEPEIALVAGPEGTEIATRIIHSAPAFLKQGGSLIMEMGIGQAGELRRMVEKAGAYKTPEVLKDLAGIDRVIVAKRS